MKYTETQKQVNQQWNRYQRMKPLYHDPKLVTPTGIKRLTELVETMHKEILEHRNNQKSELHPLFEGIMKSYID